MIHFVVEGCDTTPATGPCCIMSWNQCTEGSCRLEICGNSLEHLTFSSYPKMTFERPNDLNKAINNQWCCNISPSRFRLQRIA